MWDRIKTTMRKCLDVVAAVFLVIVVVGYVICAGITTTFVINDLRLDTYIDFSTGMEIVLLFYLLVWVPILAFRAVGGRR